MEEDRLQDRPVAGFVLSLVGGLFATIGSSIGLLLFAGYASYYNTLYFAFVVCGVAIGIVMIVAGALLYVRPHEHVVWGVVETVSASLSILGVLGSYYGGFILVVPGLVLGIVGGALGIAWKPYGATMAGSIRICLSCGRQVPAEYAFCPHCGAPAPMGGLRPSGAGPGGPPMPPP